MEELQHEQGQETPVWAIFGDMMAGVVGIFVLILVWVLGYQVELAQSLREEVSKQLPGAEVATHRDALFAAALGAALWGAYRHHRIAARQGRTQDAAA